MALLSSVFRQLCECFPHFLRRRETPLRAQQCAAQECALEKEVKRKVKEKREINEGVSCKSKAEEARETLSLEKMKARGYVHQKKRESAKFKEMQSLEKLMERGSEHREGRKKKKEESILKKQKTIEPAPLLVEVKPEQAPLKPSFLKPIEGVPMLPSVSEHFAFPAARFKLLPPVTKSPMHPQKPAPAPEEVSLPCPPKLLVVPPRPIPAPDELFSHQRSQVSPSKQLVVPPSPIPAPDEVVSLECSSTKASPPSLAKPQLSTSSLVEPPPQLMLIDIEDEENEYVEYTGETLRACDFKSELPRMKPRMAAWLESDSEVLANEVVEVQGCEEQDPNEVGDSKVIQGHSDDTSQKKKEMDEHMTKLFCVTSPEGPKNETQQKVNIQEERTSKRKVPLVLFTWIEDEVKKKEEKKIQKEKERREKRLLLARYRTDPKMKHLLINIHNCNYCSSK